MINNREEAKQIICPYCRQTPLKLTQIMSCRCNYIGIYIDNISFIEREHHGIFHQFSFINNTLYRIHNTSVVRINGKLGLEINFKTICPNNMAPTTQQFDKIINNYKLLS